MTKQETVPTVKIGGRVFKLPYLSEVRPLTDQERTRLRESIQEDGIKTPIVIDEHDNVIDGANRLQLAAELGLPLSAIPLHVVKGLSEGQKQAMAWKLNEDRRQLTQAEMKEGKLKRIERVAAKRAEGKSFPRIAEEEGVSERQVRKDLKLVDQDSLPDKVMGRNGVRYPARHKKGKERQERIDRVVSARMQGKTNKEIAETEGVDPATVAYWLAKASLTDDVGQEVPLNLYPVFAARADYDKLLSLLSQAAEIMNQLRDGEQDRGIRQEHVGARRELYEKIKRDRPFAVCQKCHGAGANGKPCKTCKSRGWLTKDAHEAGHY